MTKLMTKLLVLVFRSLISRVVFQRRTLIMPHTRFSKLVIMVWNSYSHLMVLNANDMSIPVTISQWYALWDDQMKLHWIVMFEPLIKSRMTGLRLFEGSFNFLDFLIELVCLFQCKMTNDKWLRVEWIVFVSSKRLSTFQASVMELVCLFQNLVIRVAQNIHWGLNVWFVWFFCNTTAVQLFYCKLYFF